MYLRRQRDVLDAERFIRFVAVAALVHEGVLGLALALAPSNAIGGPPATHAVSGIELLLEAPAFAAPLPEPPLESEPSPPPPPLPPPERSVAPVASTAPAVSDVTERAEAAVAAAADVIAAAAKVLTRDDPSDGTSFASGEDGPGYGLVAGDGRGMHATRNGGAAIRGKRGGTGHDTGAAPPATDRSRPAHVIGGYAENCAFPREADNINHAVVSIVVSVRSDGTAASVAVATDPGHGFGRSARKCALRRRYEPARDRDGRPTIGLTAPITVRFTR